MAISISELIQNLAESGLMSLDEITTIHDDFRSRHDSGEQRSADSFAKELVRKDFLTKLQAAAVLKGKTKNLVFGDYVVLEKIGSGGMGQVFRAKHKQTDKIVALKVLSADAVKNRRLIERFKKEAKAVSRLKHPNVVRAYEAGKINRIRYLVMEFVDGENMLQRVKRKGPLPIDEVVHCVLHAARGLEYAHGKGIIHRDIKPSNLLRNRRNGRVKVLDLGLARVDDGDDSDEDAVRLTIPGQMLGTARFMAPEQVEDARKSDIPSDVYSLGCTMYYLLRGKAPYSGETVAHTLMAHVSAPIPDLCKKRKDVPKWLGDVFRKMMAKKPADRFQTMGDLVAEIQHHLGADMHSPSEEEQHSEDEYSKLIDRRNEEEGTSLAELYDDDDSGQPAEHFASADRADIDTAETRAAGGVDDDIPNLETPKPRFSFTARSTNDEEVDLNDIDLEDDDDIEDEDVASQGVGDDDDGEVLVAQTADFKLADEPDAVETFNDEVAGAQEFQISEKDIQSGRDSEVRDYVSEKLNTRKRMEQSSNRRAQIVGITIGSVIAISTIVYFLTR